MQGFLWGVATSPYQAEGGYNGPGQPQTNWARAEREGQVAPLGQAAEFWTRYPEDFALCRQMGLSAFRLGLEWSRIQPTLDDRPGPPPDFDLAALDHYAGMLVSCREHGLEPVLTLHHFTHPAWLGPDPWLSPSTVGHFAAYVRHALRHVNRALLAAGLPPVRYYITLNEPNMLAFNTYVGGQFPGAARRGLHNASAACCQMLCAHIAAYNAIHDLYAEEGWPSPMVTLNNYCSDLYWADKLLLDLLSLRERQIPPGQAEAYVRAKARAFGRALLEARIPLQKGLSYGLGVLCKEIGYWLCHRHFAQAAFLPLLDSLAQSPRERLFDYLALDYYDPFTAHLFRTPVWWDHEFQNRSLHAWVMNTVTSKWWDWRALPQGLHFFCRHYAEDFPGRPVLIAENGMALRRRTDNDHSRRRDGLSRSQFLRLHVQAVAEMLGEGLPLLGYLHWSLFDNYEWGTYTPRFGLYSLNYQQGTGRLAQDHYGDCPSVVYADLIRDFNARLGRVGRQAQEMRKPGLAGLALLPKRGGSS